MESWVASPAAQLLPHTSTDSDCAAISLAQKADSVCHTIIDDDGKNPTVRLSATLWDSISSNERSKGFGYLHDIAHISSPLSGKERGGRGEGGLSLPVKDWTLGHRQASHRLSVHDASI
ncbi:hypothetical protein TMEN_173 [Trichophyton mentagrophytes]|nr:hypothetical protein TMEN_173 [Trichophyton mentagrophytes]